MRDTIQHLCAIFRVHCLDYWRQARELPPPSRKFLFIPKRLVAASTQDTYYVAYGCRPLLSSSLSSPSSLRSLLFSSLSSLLSSSLSFPRASTSPPLTVLPFSMSQSLD